jgi:uncharacterized protein
VSYEKPVPVIDADSEPYWAGAREGRLMIQRCHATGQHFLYSRRLTPGVDDAEVQWVAASGKGRVYSYTVARRPAGPAFKADVPYAIASITLDEGARILANIVTDNPNSVHIGQRVEVLFDAVTPELTIPKFKPVP